MSEPRAAYQYVNQDSGETEWYTPPEIIEAARAVMGGIDLDPASSPQANKTVKADHYFTAQDDGLARPWFGRVFLNHPFSRRHNHDWIAKLVRECLHGHVVQAVCITWNSTDANWFKPLLRYPRWHPPDRINFIDGRDGDPRPGATKAAVVTYLGPSVATFHDIFTHRLGGHVDVPYSMWAQAYHAAIRPGPALMEDLL